MKPTRALYEFGDFVLDVGQQRLTRRTTSTVIPLTAKVFDTLVYLVEHAGEALDKDSLLRSIWPGVVVEENSLTQNISLLRQALGETRKENRYIATLPRKGYRFVAEVRRLEPGTTLVSESAPDLPSAPESHFWWQQRPWLMAGVALLGILLLAATWVLNGTRQPAAAASSQTLAILPFKPLLPADRNESLELGMTESLIASLGKDSEQAVIPLSSVRRYGALDQNPIAAGRDLGAHTVLEGSLQRREDRLRVSVRLLRVADAKQLWAESFDEEFTSIFQVQDTISAKVAQALSIRSRGTHAQRGNPHTQNPEAYLLYASGRFAWTKQNEPSLLQAIAFFEQAIALDPNYALAYTGLADSYAVLGVFGIRAPHEVFPRARIAADKALQLDPDLASAHSARGHIKVQYEHDWDGAAKDYARAIELDPSLALTHHRLGLLYAMQGDTERALAQSARAQQLEPLWIALRGGAANFLYYAERYEEAIRLVEGAIQLDERANGRGVLIRSLIAKGEYDRALSEYDKGPLQVPGSNAFRAQALALSGRREEAREELARVLEKSKTRYVPAYEIALIHAALGDTQNAFSYLERAVEDRSTLINFLAQEPALQALRSDSRFPVLVKRIGIYGRVLPPMGT